MPDCPTSRSIASCYARFCISFCVFAACFLVAVLRAGSARAFESPAVPADKEPVCLESRRELMLDRWLFESLDGLTFRMHRPTLKEKVFDFDAPWEGRPSFGFSVTGYATVMPHRNRFRMYYASWFGHRLKPADPLQQFTGYAESADGIHWSRPNLGRVEFDGSKQNNILFQGGRVSHNFAPFRDTRPGIPADEQFKAIGGNGKAWIFASPDGLAWRKLQEEPVIDGEEEVFDRIGAIRWGNNPGKERALFDSHNLAFWDEARGCYAFYFRAHVPALNREGSEVAGTIRTVLRATSRDFRNWSHIEPIDFGEARRLFHHELYTTSLLPYARAPHLLIGLPLRTVPRRPLKGTSFGLSETALLFSRDGRRFTLKDEPFLPPGRDVRNWTKHGNMSAWGMLQTAPDELSCYFQQHDHQATTHLRRGVLRVDGFMSLHAGRYPGGTATSRPLTFVGNRLELNVATSAAGSVCVSILDAESGKPLPGFEQSDEFWGDRISHIVHWGGRNDVSMLAGRTIRLRFEMNNADLYSLRFLPER